MLQLPGESTSPRREGPRERAPLQAFTVARVNAQEDKRPCKDLPMKSGASFNGLLQILRALTIEIRPPKTPPPTNLLTKFSAHSRKRIQRNKHARVRNHFQDGPGPEPEPEIGTVGTVFPGTGGGTGTVGAKPEQEHAIP